MNEARDGLGPGRPYPPPSSLLVEAARRGGVRDEGVLDALGRVPRSHFVPRELLAESDLDIAIPIGYGQTTTQPSLVALMVEALEVRPTHTVLEVGTGTGYQAAVLSPLASRVYTVERVADLVLQARRNLEGEGIANVVVVAGDGTLGLAEHAPYDRIIVAAAFPAVPPPLVDQLAEGGRLVQPVGPGGRETVAAYEKIAGSLQRRQVLTRAAFVPLVGAYGFSPEST